MDRFRLQPADSHTTTVVKNSPAPAAAGGAGEPVGGRQAAGARLDLARRLEHDEYSVSCVASAGVWRRTGPHSFVLALPAAAAAGAGLAQEEEEEQRTVAVSCRYALGCCVGTAPPKAPAWLSAQPVPLFEAVRAQSVAAGRSYWEAGAFVDLAGATDDPRAAKLERIVVQSQALLRTMGEAAVLPFAGAASPPLFSPHCW